MPKIACRTCGRQVYTVAPPEALFAEERRCPRCGTYMDTERRAIERRQWQRRASTADRPGPPDGVAERRIGDRRVARRRRDVNAGWVAH
jgi:hypothetical protein